MKRSGAAFLPAPEPKELWIVPGADHDRMHFAQPAEYARRVLEFLRRRLR